MARSLSSGETSLEFDIPSKFLEEIQRGRAGATASVEDQWAERSIFKMYYPVLILPSFSLLMESVGVQGGHSEIGSRQVVPNAAIEEGPFMFPPETDDREVATRAVPKV